MRFSENALSVSAGDTVPDDLSNFRSNLDITVSRSGLNVTSIGFLNANGVFIITMDNTNVQLGDTVKINLNQFQDSNGFELSGILVLTYSETPDSPWGTPNGWVSSFE